MQRKLRHDRHTVSLLTDHMVFSPEYRGKILTGDIAVNPDHVHLFMKYPPKYSVSFIAKRIKGKSSRVLRNEFPHLKEWCRDHLWAPNCYHGSVGNGWEVVERYISAHNTYEYNKKIY